MPKLDKLKPEDLVSISKKMFYGGFAFLPFLWLVNFMYFFSASRAPSAPQQLKKSGCVAWFIALTTWYAIFVQQRVAWGATADQITVVIPKGS
ncbi:hypothetical protein DFQ29_002001 [Apophysomyces sp. BC1021]|nr:hypothetical protein DFQ29_002001 [Apophysomyces sp. BC1021]